MVEYAIGIMLVAVIVLGLVNIVGKQAKSALCQVAGGMGNPLAAAQTTATRVYGQLGNLTTGYADNGGITADSLDTPTSVALDSGGNLYATDDGNNRVLYYPAGSTTATRVYGQLGSFTANAVNNGGISADSLYKPDSVALDSGGNLYIVDQFNARVLYYPAGSTTATRVYGQGGSFTTNTVNKNGVSADSLHWTRSVAVDSGNNLYVGDNQNNRVLYYPAGSTTATRVYGQGGSFTTSVYNNGGVSADSLSDPWQGLAADKKGGLYVGDYDNNRVLYYPAGSTTAVQVYGQLGDFTTNGFSLGATPDNLGRPDGIAIDSIGGIYVADYGSHRIVYYPPGSC